ncbi:MAG: LuxR C-terminal-related transcriptional regulator [Candidatus Dormibacteraeota bacterium]|nr:LuxR C-terminal-related transcriptional regulator [Candidatus Dormibacteraeota bacterium]
MTPPTEAGSSAGNSGVRLAELLATVSLASDLAHDVPAESALRDALFSVRLARLAGWSRDELSDTYYLALLYHVGCTGAVSIQSRMGAGDDVGVRKWLSEADFANRPELMRIVITRMARQWGPRQWAAGVAGMISSNGSAPEAFASVADVAVRLSTRLGASPRVSAALRHTYARWDGTVFPDLPQGDEQSALARLVHLVHVAQTYHQVGGIPAADTVVRERSGGELDPQLARLWLQNSHDMLEGLGLESVWDHALAEEPEPHVWVSPAHLDEVCRALADFVDLKSPYTRGHSPQVARLVEGAASGLGLAQAEITTLRRAAQVHDLGNVSIPDLVWTKRGALNPSERARVELHAYHTQRILTVSPALRASGEIAGLHHERIDGSGYHRGLPAAALPLGARVLVAAEVYQSITEDRSWRPGFEPAAAAGELRREVSDGKLDRRAVDAVLGAAGHRSKPSRAARGWPAGLTDREVDVLRLLARGHSNKQIAASLHVSEATVHTHLINVYGKIGVSTRAGATLFALEHDLVQIGSG